MCDRGRRDGLTSRYAARPKAVRLRTPKVVGSTRRVDHSAPGSLDSQDEAESLMRSRRADAVVDGSTRCGSFAAVAGTTAARNPSRGFDRSQSDEPRGQVRVLVGVSRHDTPTDLKRQQLGSKSIAQATTARRRAVGRPNATRQSRGVQVWILVRHPQNGRRRKQGSRPVWLRLG